VIALGIGRRTRSLRAILRSATAVGAHVILITDQASRAGKDIASITLRCRTRGVGVFDSAVAAVSLTTHLSSALALRIGQSAIERLEFIDRIHEDWDDVLTEDI
jgi:DNA-binding MurR/RpiR family transcriptional regulator